MGKIALCFGIDVPTEGCCLTPCYMLLITFKKCLGKHYSRKSYSVLHTDRPSSAEYDTLKQLGARLHLMSGDIGSHLAMIALPLRPRARGRSPPATTIVIERPLGASFFLAE